MKLYGLPDNILLEWSRRVIQYTQRGQFQCLVLAVDVLQILLPSILVHRLLHGGFFVLHLRDEVRDGLEVVQPFLTLQHTSNGHILCARDS